MPLRMLFANKARISSILICCLATLDLCAASPRKDTANAAEGTNQQKVELVLRTGHRGGVHGVDFSPVVPWANLGFPSRKGKGELLATGGNDGDVLLWDIRTGNQVRHLGLGNGSSVLAVVFSPDGRRIAAGGNLVRIWDVKSGALLHTYHGISKGAIQSLAFSRSGTYIAAGTQDEVLVWDVKSESIFRRFEMGYAQIAFGPGTMLAAAASMPLEAGKSVDMSIPYVAKVWDVQTGAMTSSVRGDTYYVKGVALDADNSLLVWGSSNCVDGQKLCNSIILWKSGMNKKQSFTGPPYFVTASKFCRNPNFIAGATHDGKAALWDVSRGKAVYESTGVSGAFSDGVACSDDRNTMASAEMRGRVILWSTSSPKPRQILEGMTNEADTIQFSDNETTLVEGNRGPSYETGYLESVSIWGLGTDGVPRFLDASLPVAATSDGRWLAYGTNNHTQVLLRDNAGHELKTDIPPYARLAFSKDGTRIASADQRELAAKVSIWTVNPWKKLLDIPVIADYRLEKLAFSPDGSLLASAGDDSTLVIWDTQSGKVACRLGTHTDPSHALWTVAFSPDGSEIAWGGNDEVINIADPTHCKPFWQLKGHKGAVHDVTFSPKGDRIASAGWDGTVRVWSLQDRTEVSILFGHNWLVSSVAFNNKGTLLLSAGWDGTARLWDLSAKKELATIVTFRDQKNWLVATPEGLFDSSAQAGDKVFWRSTGDNELQPLESYYTDYFHPGLLAELFDGGHPKPAVDISSVVRMPGLRLALHRKRAHLDIKDDGLVVCFDSVPGVAVQALPGEADIPAELNGYRVVPKDPNCRYRKEIPSGAADRSRLRSELEDWAAERLTTPWDGKPSTTHNSTLRVLAVGVGQSTADSGFDLLPYAEPSARAIRDFFRGPRSLQLGYSKVIVDDGLFGRDATRRAIIDKFQRLTSTVRPEDVIVLYLAGHGVVTQGQEMFYFVPYDGRATDIQQSGLDTAALAEALRNLPARRIVVIIDACQSGGALDALTKIAEVKARVEERRGKMRPVSSSHHEDGVGIHLIAAALPLAYAIQSGPNESALASTVLDLFRQQGNETITILKLIDYVNTHLPGASEQRQHFRQVPLTNSVGLDFPIIPAAARKKSNATSRVGQR